MKKIICMAMPLALALCACGGGEAAVTEKTAVPEKTAAAEKTKVPAPEPTSTPDTSNLADYEKTGAYTYSLNDSWTLNEDMTGGKDLVSVKYMNIGRRGSLTISQFIYDAAEMVENEKSYIATMSDYYDTTDSVVSEISVNDLTGYENVFTSYGSKYRLAMVGKNGYTLYYTYYAPEDEYDTYLQEVLDFEKTIQYNEEQIAQYLEEEAVRYYVTECGGLTFDTPKDWEGEYWSSVNQTGYVMPETTEDGVRWWKVTLNGHSELQMNLYVYQDASRYDVDALCADYEAVVTNQGQAFESESISSNGFTGRLYCVQAVQAAENYAGDVIAIASDGKRLYELDLWSNTYFYDGTDITVEEARDHIRDFVNSIREE